MPCRKLKENGSYFYHDCLSQQQYFSVHILDLQAWSVPLISVVKGML